jgi:mRNA-degrading endonuclease RelE of RelBE toxin-antitoxin system
MVKKVADYQLTQRFKKDYKALPKEIQESFEKKLILFLEDMGYPSLRVKRIQGTVNRWEGSVAIKYRFTFKLIENAAIFMTIGTHDILNRQS